MVQERLRLNGKNMKTKGIDNIFIMPNRKISVFRVMSRKILGRVGTPFFLEKNIQFYAFCLSKCIELYFFQKT